MSLDRIRPAERGNRVQAVEPRRTTIEGRPVLVFEHPNRLPPTLAALRREMRVTFELPLRRFGGAAAACAGQEHRLIRFLEGVYLGRDAVIRRLRCLICQDCEAVCVRDITLDRMPGLSAGRLAPRRRDVVIGWYTGARPGQREYR